MPAPNPNHAKVVIIGSGPAGLTAAVYAARANLAPIVFAGHMYGGQLMLTTEVENYPGFPNGIMGPELMEAFRAQAERFGSVIHNVDVTEVDFSKRPFIVRTAEDEYTADSVIVATGANARWLNIPGEARLRGRGVSTCATCDGAFFRDKHIVVVGGGDSAMEEALFLTRFGRRVTVIHRRDALRASKIMAERALNHEKISFVWNTAVEEVIGEDATGALKLKNLVNGEETVLQADALFIAIGHDPNTAIFQGQLDLDAAGYIASQDGVRTNVEGVFVAGDVYDIRYKQAITAAGMGCKAAIDSEKYLESLETTSQSRGTGLMSAPSKGNIGVATASDGSAAASSAVRAYPHAIDVFRRMDGLEALLMMQRDEVPKTNITRWMNFSLETVERGRVVFSMEPEEKLYNMIGSVHGGIITTLMDNALGSAVQSVLPAGRVATTMDLHTRFHRPVTAATGKVFADAHVVHAGRRSATSEAHLVDAAGTVYATGTSTLMILEDKPAP